jgi:transposase
MSDDDTAAEIHDNDVLLAQDTGLVSQCIVEEDVVGKGSRLSVADRRRNARLERLRVLVPAGNAILGIDLADEKQQAVLCDHDSRVIRRWRLTAKAWRLGPLLEQAAAAAVRAGFASVTVACEPTGHRWQIIAQLAEAQGLPMVCIQPLVMRRAREQEDYTTEKLDAKDAVLIARLAAKLHCYLPERIDERWGRLRHAGARRAQLIQRTVGQQAQMRDLLECVWPAALAAAPREPFASPTWLACLHVVTTATDGRPQRARRWGLERFTAAVRGALGRFGGQRLRPGIVAGMFTALADTTGVHARRPGALQRVGWVLDDWQTSRTAQAVVEAAMLDVLDELQLRELVDSIPGVSPIGAAAILAETGDPARFTHARAMVKHAGLNPRSYESGQYTGTTRLSGRGRPALRLAAWRAVFAALRHNPVLQAAYQRLTSRADNPLTGGQAQASLAGTLLRWLHAICTTGTRWDAQIAAGKRDLELAA